jgi:hemerythrin-like domain-containing protein
MTITEALIVEHGVFRALFSRIERDLQSYELAEAKHISCLVEHLLHRHGEQEKDLALTALNHALAEKGQLDRLHLEHHELDAAFKRVQGAAEPLEAQRLLQAGLIASRQHFDYEEVSLFALIERVLQRKALKELGSAWLRGCRK